MPESIETTVNAIPADVIRIPPAAAAAVVSLAVYGAQDLTRKGISKVKRIHANRKAVKANNPKTEPAAPQA